VIAADDALPPGAVCRKPVELALGETVLEQMAAHQRRQVVPIGEIQGQEALLVQQAATQEALRRFGMEILDRLARLALHEYCIGPDFLDRGHGQQIGAAEMIKRPHERGLTP
jgi:hypothetical protein